MVCNTDEPCAYRGRNNGTSASSSSSSSDYGGSYGKWQDDQSGAASAPPHSKNQPQCRMVPAGRFGMVRSCSNDPSITLQDLKDFGTGFWEGTKELGTGLLSSANMARECGLSMPVFTDYSACYQHVSAMVTNIKDHPGDILAKIVDAKDWNDHKYWKWAGHLAPTVIGLLLTKGAGASEEAGAVGTADVASSDVVLDTNVAIANGGARGTIPEAMVGQGERAVVTQSVRDELDSLLGRGQIQGIPGKVASGQIPVIRDIENSGLTATLREHLENIMPGNIGNRMDSVLGTTVLRGGYAFATYDEQLASLLLNISRGVADIRWLPAQ
jgi:hypothetical protein